MNIMHLGRDTWLLYYLPTGRGQNSGDHNACYSDFEPEKFAADVNRYVKRNIIAFSCKGQGGAAEGFAQLGFTKVLQFYSAHGGAKEMGEIITMWRKYNRAAPKNDNTPAQNYYGNCSITTNRSRKAHRCIIWIKQKDEKAPEGFRRIGKSNLYIKINGEIL